jgi:hypothetical protein
MKSHIPPKFLSKRYPEAIRLCSVFKHKPKIKKIFPSVNLTNKSQLIKSKYISDVFGSAIKIVFSSTGNQGAWDIATMSERGISSCQSWNRLSLINETLGNRIIGSIIDPYAGIIYISPVKNPNLMICRSIVRFVINKENKKPYLLLERLYFTGNFYYVGNALNGIGYAIKHAMNLFESFLRKESKLPVITAGTTSLASYEIPKSNVVSKLKKQYLSYRDSGIPYGRTTDRKLSAMLRSKSIL